MKKIWKISSTLLLSSFLVFTFSTTSQSQIEERTIKDTIRTDIFKVIYSESKEQPIELWYKVQCPMGDASRSGMDFYKVDGIHTSDNDDYKDNVWDKGHLAPAAAFNCDKQTLKKTFSYLNCALQHQGLNRGPWKELEEFERGLAKVYSNVNVHITVHFKENETIILSTGAIVPSGFTKEIITDKDTFTFTFPNRDVKGIDWGTFLMAK